MELCRYLRWKTFSRDSGDPAEVRESLLRGQVQLSCLKTCQPWGPDDDVASPEGCTGQRSCFVRDPLAGPPAPPVA
jgi:hypothetical protein